jgi:hypothetical protein
MLLHLTPSIAAAMSSEGMPPWDHRKPVLLYNIFFYSTLTHHLSYLVLILQTSAFIHYIHHGSLWEIY